MYPLLLQIIKKIISLRIQMASYYINELMRQCFSHQLLNYQVILKNSNLLVASLNLKQAW